MFILAFSTRYMLYVTACGLVYITHLHDIDFCNITHHLISPKNGGLSFLAHKILLYMIVLTVGSIPCTVLGMRLYQQAEEAVDILYTHTLHTFTSLYHEQM